MKVAVCLSGICRGKVQRNLQELRKHFPYDYFFSTWEGREEEAKKLLPGEEILTFPEPKMHYHPVIDIPEELVTTPKMRIHRKNYNAGQYSNRTDGYGVNMRTRTLNHTKQILAHAYQLQTLDPSYDMIIRVRYDVLVSDKVDFTKYLNDSYNNREAIGFGVRGTRHKTIHAFKEVEKVYPNEMTPSHVSHDWGWYLMDPLIFHPRSMFDIGRTLKLHEEKKLMAAEWGWYQILSKPYGDNHRCIYGGAQIEKYL